jgi:hypothetical protein
LRARRSSIRRKRKNHNTHNNNKKHRETRPRFFICQALFFVVWMTCRCGKRLPGVVNAPRLNAIVQPGDDTWRLLSEMLAAQDVQAFQSAEASRLFLQRSATVADMILAGMGAEPNLTEVTAANKAYIVRESLQQAYAAQARPSVAGNANHVATVVRDLSGAAAQYVWSEAVLPSLPQAVGARLRALV